MYTFKKSKNHLNGDITLIIGMTRDWNWKTCILDISRDVSKNEEHGMNQI